MCSCNEVCNDYIDVGVARGVQWVHLHPQDGEKFF